MSILAIEGKRPYGRRHRHWKEDAFRGADAIEAWGKTCRSAHVSGIAIVIPPHVCIVDVDGEAGATALKALIGKLPDWGAVARTGRGLHLWFVSPHEIRNGKLAEKLDIKSVGGYVVAPPSRHYDEEAKAFTRKTYEWLSPLISSEGTLQVDWLPEPIEDLLAERAQQFRPPIEHRASGSIDGLAGHVRRSTEGSRNQTLNWAAWTARREGIPFALALSALTESAVAAGLQRDEAMRTIRSAYASKEERP